MKIKGFIGTSLLDYPKKISSILFLGGCDFKCPFCQNPDLISGTEKLPSIRLDAVLKQLEERKKFIDGVVISGGEPTIHKELPKLIKPIKNLGFPVKIDTNGNNPDLIEDLLDNKLVDYIAMDIKTSFDRYNEAAGIELDIDRVKRSVGIIKEKAPDYEFRTTVVPILIEGSDIVKIANDLAGVRAFYLHQFRSMITYNKDYSSILPYHKKTLFKFRDILKETIDIVKIRGL